MHVIGRVSGFRYSLRGLEIKPVLNVNLVFWKEIDSKFVFNSNEGIKCIDLSQC